MRDALPTVADIRAIYFKAQRKKNIIPQHANLTPKFNREIVKLIDSIASEKDLNRLVDMQGKLNLLLVAKKDYENSLFQKMRDDLEKRILNPPQSVRLRTRKVGDRVVTVFNKPRPTLMLLDRFVALHLTRAFGVQTKGRDQCVRILNNTFLVSSRVKEARQGVIKMDLDQFYASIDHKLLLAKVDGHAGVPRFVKQHVRLVLDAYARINGAALGIPDGVPSSAVLAEIYLENFDSALRSNPEVALYLRYVDDIVIVCEPERLAVVSLEVEQQLRSAKLKRNAPKSTELTHPAETATSFDYLGYKFKFEKTTSKLSTIDISDTKLERYLVAASRLSKHADGIICWASRSAVDEYLAAFEYLFRAHATGDAGDGVRIVTGLAYNARFMKGDVNSRSNFNRLLKLSKKEAFSRRAFFTTGLAKGAKPVCKCCGSAIPRSDELLSLNGLLPAETGVMHSAALAHSEEELRSRVRTILWN